MINASSSGHRRSCHSRQVSSPPSMSSLSNRRFSKNDLPPTLPWTSGRVTPGYWYGYPVLPGTGKLKEKRMNLKCEAWHFKWEARMTEQTDSGQKVNFRQICNALGIADRSGGQAWPSRQIRGRKSISDRIETKTALQRELKMKALKAERKGIILSILF